MIYQNGEIYILCSQWFEYQRECLESWINRPDATEKIKTTVVSNPDDFIFSVLNLFVFLIYHAINNFKHLYFNQ